MKPKWKTMKLGEVCDFEGGTQPPKSQFIFEERPGFIRFLQIRDFGSDKNITYIPNSKKNRLCLSDDILIGRYGASVGKVLTNKSGAYNVALMKTIPNLKLLDRTWFYNYLISNEFQGHLLKVADRSAQAGFSKDDIYNFPVPVPPLPEQRRIVGILDEAFEGIATANANAEKNLRNARALISPAFMSILNTFDRSDWHASTVENVSQNEKGAIRTGPFGSDLLHSEFVEDGIPVLGIDNAVQNRFAWNERRYITPQKYSQLSRFQVKPGDVLITIMGTCGRCAIVPDNIPTAITSKHLCGITLDHRKCLPEFFHGYFLYHPTVQELLTKKAKGAIMAGLNTGIIRELPILLPNVAQQKTIIKKMNTIRESTDVLETCYQRKLAALDELKKSLLHQAFTGQL